MLIEIVNTRNTSGDWAPGGLSWIDYWRQQKRSTIGTCQCNSCTTLGLAKMAEGAHVNRVVTNPDRTRVRGAEIYIAPLCHTCNTQDMNASTATIMSIDESLLLRIK